MHQVLKNVFYEIRDPKISWNDIGGCFKIKEKIKQEVSSLDVLLLWGPKGIGIPMLAEAYAKEKNKSFIFLSTHKLFDSQIIYKKSYWCEVLQLANLEAPLVLFISDLEWIIPDRNADYEWEPGNTRGKPRILASEEMSLDFLDFFNKAINIQNINVVCSTYRLDTISNEIIKMFSKKIFVGFSSIEDRKEIFKVYIEKFNIKNRLDEAVTIDYLAVKTDGFVGNDIENICKNVVIEAIKQNINIITISIFEKVINNHIPLHNKGIIEKYKLLEREKNV